MKHPRKSLPFLLTNAGITLLFVIAFALAWVYFSRGSPTPSVQPTSVAAVATAPLPVLAPTTAAPTELPPTEVPTQPVATATPLPPTLTPTALPPPAPTPTFAAIGTYDPGYIPILMYHYVRIVDATSDPLGYRLSVEPEVFAQQMAWIAEQGYTTMRMSEVADCIRGLIACPERAVALTFDDGYADQAQNALPILEQYKFTATFYIVSGFVGKPNYMTWEEINRLRDAGMEIGAHTINHSDLSVISLPDAEREMGESRSLIVQNTGTDVLSFSYPAGKYTPEVATLALQLGYSNAVTTLPENSFTLLYELPRRRVLGGESLEGFRWHFRALQP